MEATVQAFNNLPRPRTTPTGLPNHWYFTIRHVPLNPPGDLVHLVHPQSEYIHCAGPRQILSLPSPAAQADVVVSLLLESFVSDMNKGPNGERLNTPIFAPWSWGTKDAELARAIEAKLKDIGVRKELCTVQYGSREDENISNESWSGFFSQLTKMTGQHADTKKESTFDSDSQGAEVCGGCKKDASSLSKPLKHCAKCGEAWYCSRECQKADWKQHKKVCGKSSSNASAGYGATSRTGISKMKAFDYYNNVAHTVPEAQNLAKSLNLTLPAGGGEGLIKPIRRLVITGKDTPENLELLLGSDWKEFAGDVYEQARLDVLLQPPPGSPSYAVHSKYDDGTPSRSPRPASSAESEKIQKVREMQASIRRHLGPRRDPTPQDMQAILSTFGPNWVEMLPLYQLAVNAMDQGVQVP